MPFAPELDDRRQEVRRGYAGNVIRFWPKQIGIGNVAVTSPSATIHRPDGNAITTITPTLTTVGSISRLDLTIDASATATYTLEENYFAVIGYTYSGQTHDSTLRFDCVLEPWLPDVSLNDLKEEEADIEQRLERQVNAIDRDGTASLTVEQLANIYAVKAWNDTRRKIKAALESRGKVIPRCIIDREGLRAVVVAQALSRIYRAEGGGPESDDRMLAEDWRDEGDLRLAGMGEIAYDSSDDRVADSTIGGWSTVQTRRAWPGSRRGDVVRS